MNSDEKLNELIKCISESANMQSDSIRRETGKFIEKNINDAEKQALSESYAVIKRKASAIRIANGAALTEKHLEADRKVFKGRNRIKNEVINRATEKIVEFTESDGYLTFLMNSLAHCKEYVGGKMFTVAIRPSDNKYKTELVGESDDVTIIEDDTIRLGGIKVTNESGSLTADDTLDTRLKSEEDSFCRNSGLIIRKISE